ncbi:hypothetical protein CHU92_02135 [Flavobacterium cyanobacteriorum]|uniref:Cobalt transporter n=1 Tax=Flavobacterium cyanobacteriorum TaxID=2022802 RepID=A0A255ZUP7_9FLAO|nr:hypothetical protein [Flavobacterium cyanobacteriorum]OYQ45213.1 hypothetical protein CHU92_02135 [Flavobacterium cyanobacteriorum]
MKRKFALFNLVLMAVVLLTTAYRSFHAFSHEHAGGHSHHERKKEAKHFGAVGHNHEEGECGTCDFHFDFFVAPQEFFLTLSFPFKPIPYSFTSIEGNTSFAGSLFALRAPPVLM